MRSNGPSRQQQCLIYLASQIASLLYNHKGLSLSSHRRLLLLEHFRVVTHVSSGSVWISACETKGDASCCKFSCRATWLLLHLVNSFHYQLRQRPTSGNDDSYSTSCSSGSPCTRNLWPKVLYSLSRNLKHSSGFRSLSVPTSLENFEYFHCFVSFQPSYYFLETH